MQDKPYVVQWLKDNRVSWEARFADIREAKNHAIAHIKLHRGLKAANCAVVLDADGSVILRVY